MARYRIEHRVETLADNAVMEEGRLEAASSIRSDTHIGILSRAEAGRRTSGLPGRPSKLMTYNRACQMFRVELNRVIPKISLIGQACIDFLQQPFLIRERKTRSV